MSVSAAIAYTICCIKIIVTQPLKNCLNVDNYFHINVCLMNRLIDYAKLHHYIFVAFDLQVTASNCK